MMKYPFILMVSVFLWGCNHPLNTTVNERQTPTTNHPQQALLPAQLLVVPGAGIGKITLNSDLNDAIKMLGKPDRTDAAMGLTFVSWYTSKRGANDDEFQLFAYRKPGAENAKANCIEKIRVTSPLYATKGGIHTGLSLSDISKQFKLVKSENPPYLDRRQLYDDLQAGIAFEIRLNHACSAIIIHAPGDKSFTSINLNKSK